MGTSNTDSESEVASETDSSSASEIDLEAEFEGESDSESASDSDAEDDSGSTSLADRLDTATTVVWAAFLAFVVVLALIPVVAVGLGAAPFTAPPVEPYFAFVGLVLVGTIAIVAVAIFDP